MKNIKSYIYTILFSMFIGLTFVVSIYNLTRFYSYDENQYNEWSAELGTPLETDYVTSLWGKMKYVNLNGLMRNVFNQPEMNGVVKLNNGYLATLIPKEDDVLLDDVTDELIRVNKYLDDKGIKLVYVQTPYVVSGYDPQLPTGYTEFGNDNIDKVLAGIKAGNVDYIDLRDKFHEAGMDQYDLWYKTDHHWTTEGAFYAYNFIADYINENTDIHIDETIGDINNFDIVKYPKWHLGSNGQRTGIYYAGIDDFDLFIPKFETNIDGKPLEEIYNYEPLKRKDYESRYTYDYVLDPFMGYHKNGKSSTDAKAIVICDSMGKAVLPFFDLSFKEVKCMEADDLTEEELQEFQPDIVIMLMYPIFNRSNYFVFDQIKQ